MTDPKPAELTVAVDPAPTPGQRIQRTAGQLGAVDILIRLVTAFGWFGAGHWTGEQATSVALAGAFMAAAAHNGWTWWRNERTRVPQGVTVTAEPAAAKPRRARGAGGYSTITWCALVALLFLLVLLAAGLHV